MFRKTKYKLVTFYTLVIFIILSVIGLTLYLYMYRLSYSSIDVKLSHKAKMLQRNNHLESPSEEEREAERRVFYLTWDSRGKFINSYPPKAVFHTDLAYLSPPAHYKKFRTQTIEGHSFRILTIKKNTSITGVLDNPSVKTLELVYDIDPEVSMLKNLLMIIGFVSAGGLILSYFAGLFLANKTLVPIQRSWEKQSRFVADASHELRTPLSVIQTHLELLFRHPLHTIEQESLNIYKSLSEVKRINKLVGDLLTLARTDSNEQLVNRVQFPLDELIKLIVQQFEPIFTMKEIQLSEEIDSNLNFYGDKDRLHQLFVILLDNALKFTSPTGKIHVTCKREGRFISIEILDTGIGISEGDLPHVFDRFYRSDKSRNRELAGTGLGLSIAKWIVDAHNGDIKIESKPNEGTRIFIKLPLKESL